MKLRDDRGGLPVRDARCCADDDDRGAGHPVEHAPHRAIIPDGGGATPRRLSSAAAMTRREHLEVGLAVLLVGTSAALHYGGVTPVLTFLAAAAAIAVLARLVGAATDQLGGRIGSSAAGVAQSALGNLPELFIALFALHAGLVGVVQGALVGSVIANGVLVLGIAFFVGGLRNGTQRFDSPRARMIATLMVLAAAILSMPALAHAFHTPAGPHARTLSFV